ncbi:hypothetical protein HN51_036551 [Arachis hypogaea]
MHPHGHGLAFSIQTFSFPKYAHRARFSQPYKINTSSKASTSDHDSAVTRPRLKVCGAQVLSYVMDLISFYAMELGGIGKIVPKHESSFLSSLFISSSISNSSGVTLCNSISQLFIHSPSFLVMRDASSRLIDYLKMEKDPDIKMPRRSTTTKKSETGTRRKMQQKTLEELESRKVIECRCSPVSVFTTINSLTKEQKLEVDKMGFSSMKAIQDWKIDRRLFLALAKSYNTTTSKLELVLGDIDVTTDKIGLAIGLPSIGKIFPEEEDWTSEQKRLVAPFKSVTNPWLQEVLHLRECNVSTSKGRDYFRRAFTMFIISSFLAPTSSVVTSPKHLRAIVDVENITRYNWARFMHDELMKGVQKFKEKNTLSIDGCLYILMIIYYHKDTFGDKENYMGPPPPWIAYWDKEKLAKKLTQE